MFWPALNPHLLVSYDAPAFITGETLLSSTCWARTGWFSLARLSHGREVQVFMFPSSVGSRAVQHHSESAKYAIPDTIYARVSTPEQDIDQQKEKL